MIIIYGSRFAGRIDGHIGQYAATRFAHVYWLPLFPLGTMWVTDEMGDSRRGHKIGLSGRSVLAAYTRAWGPVLAIIGLISGSVGAIAVGVGAAGIGAASLAWWNVRGARAERQRDFLRVTTGSSCDPSAMGRELASTMRVGVDELWAEHYPDRSVKDIARFGAESPAQAALAYTSLRLIARTTPGAEAECKQLADRLVDSVRDTSELDQQGPYRTLTPGVSLDSSEPPR